MYVLTKESRYRPSYPVLLGVFDSEDRAKAAAVRWCGNGDTIEWDRGVGFTEDDRSLRFDITECDLNRLLLEEYL